MAEYALSLVCVLLLSGLSGLLAYKSDSKYVNLAISVIVIYVSVIPVLELRGAELDFGDFVPADTPELGGEYSERAEDSFALGIKRLINDKWNIPEDNVEVRLTGFDFSKMRAEHIWIGLLGNGASVDTEALEKYIEEKGLGACEAEYLVG